MNSQFFKYSPKGTPIILFFLGILGVIWGSTFFMGVLVCIGLFMGICDTALQYEQYNALGIRSRFIDEGFIENVALLFLLAFLGPMLFWALGFYAVIFYFTYRFVKYAFLLQKDLKIATSFLLKNR